VTPACIKTEIYNFQYRRGPGKSDTENKEETRIKHDVMKLNQARALDYN